jgi:hypothetical protein
VADLARLAGRATERDLREEWHRLRMTTHLNELIAYGCMTYGARQMENGVKRTAATRLAGYRSHWGHNKQSHAYAARLSPFGPLLMQIGPDEIARALEKFDSEMDAIRERERERERERRACA